MTFLVDNFKKLEENKLPDYFNIDGYMSKDSTFIATEFNNYFAYIGQSLSNFIKQPKNRSFKEFLKNQVNWHLKTLAREIHCT